MEWSAFFIAILFRTKAGCRYYKLIINCVNLYKKEYNNLIIINLFDVVE